MNNNFILNNRRSRKHAFTIKSAYTSTKYKKYQAFEDLFKKNNKSPHAENNRLVPCPKCGGKLKINHDDHQDHYYQCLNCHYLMEFSEYQKRFINLNWDKQIKNGIVLYSWDGICPNCKQQNPFLSYCINENFGTEELCEYEPILLGCVPKIDGFIMRFCRAINKFPNTKKELSARIFCSKCDAPIPYSSLVDSFLSQSTLDVEFVIKKELLTGKINLQPEDITKTMNYLVLLDISD